MAKIYGLFGAMTGKLADSVMVVRNGEQLVRKYQPVVSNPSTPAQVSSRAKLKLMSQLSEVMADAIAFRKQGSVSARNLFTKANYRLTSYSDNAANVDMYAVDLTGGIMHMPAPTTTSTSGSLSLSVPANQATDFDKVIYAVFEYGPNSTLIPRGVVVAQPGTDGSFPASVQLTGNSATGIAYAYGIRENSEAARTFFDNLSVIDTQHIGRVLTSSSLLETDVTLSRTSAAAFGA